MKDFSPAFCSALDQKNELLINKVNKNYGLGYASANESRYYGNITASSKSIYEYFLYVRAYMIRYSKPVHYIHLYDVGCGIGNVLELLMLLFRADPVFGKHLKGIYVGGIERLHPYIEIANPILSHHTPYVNLTCGDFCADRSMLHHYYRHNEKVGASMKTGKTLNIVTMNRPIKDLEEEARLERIILSSAPSGTFFHFPMGCVALPSKGFTINSTKEMRKGRMYGSI